MQYIFAVTSGSPPFDESWCSYGVTVELVDEADPLQLEVPVPIRLVKYTQNPKQIYEKGTKVINFGEKVNEMLRSLNKISKKHPTYDFIFV